MQKFRPIFALLLGLLTPFFMFLLSGTSMRIAFALAAVLYFALGLFFARDGSYNFWGKGLYLVGPFIVLILLLAGNQWPLYLIPLAAIVSTYGGLYLGQLWPSDVRPLHVLLGGLWLVTIAGVGFWLLPHLLEQNLTRAENTPAPEFKLQTLDSLVVQSSGLQGKVVILDFWATWCGPCVQQFPELQQLYEAFADEPRVAFLAINTGWGEETPEKARLFIETKGYSFPVAFDDSGRVTMAFGVRSIPHTVLIDPQGIIRVRHVGFVEKTGAFFQNMRRHIEELLQEGANRQGTP